MISLDEFKQNLASVCARMDAACLAAGRDPASVQLLPVTKNHPEAAPEYVAACGLGAVGENRVQEAVAKQAACTASLRWELIGHLQSNKAKEAVAHFDRVQSVDSLKLIQRLNRMAADSGKCLPILLQFNTGEDPNKYGFSCNEADAVLEAALACPHLQVEGFMTIAPLDDDLEVAKVAFDGLRALRDRLADSFQVPLSELSMGMTGDLEVAITAGSTQIRVGTALFGSRGY
ncbi:YggS family pyridoxal phosphate-dependent enzyme [Coraliomargarita parva]|uniref:YggS family pyridoxal phosphate-dependent enzyme n=1 Tax=Coraliomargarita parva TaxID=3014050 RepID=UPI0022B4E5E9|nr:YggS family pyridoxal phosphate-dependent enzyme [Coraliomargarita parva]